jgi:magnesium transporter
MVPIRRPFRRKRLLAGPRQIPGTAPGQLTVSPLSHPSQVFLIGYGPEGYVEHSCENIDEIEQFLSAWPVVWVNVIGLGSLDTIEKVGAQFGLDRLLLEDVLDTNHRQKIEYYENYIFTIIKGGMHTEQFESEQISIILKKNVVIVFEEKPGSSFNQVRERVRRGTGRIRQHGTDYLYYALLDEVIDKYFPILDKLNHQLAAIEEEVMVNNQHTSDKDTIQQIHHAKSDLLLLHRTIWPISDIISMIMREETPLITKGTRNFLRDCYDHSIQANELTQFYRDTASGLLNTFLAYEGHKTNEIIKVLTLVTALFIPLNFVASIYGMNFSPDVSPLNMPELRWYFGYPFAMGLMLLVAAVMLFFFKRRGWLESLKSTRK